MIKVKFANLINIILNKQLIPELIQYNCKENRIYQELKNLINNENICQKQVKEAQLALNILGLNSKTSSTQKIIDECLKL